MTTKNNRVFVDVEGNHVCNECAKHHVAALGSRSYTGEYLFCCKVCHREHLNGVLTAPAMPKPKAKPVHHPKSGYTGHSAKHDGLQGHSIGELYPCIIVGYGDGSSGVMLGGLEVRGLTDKTAREMAAEVKDVIDRQGYRLGIIRLHSLSIRSFMNT